MEKVMSDNLTRPYLVIPKLIEQPTWGGTYIVESKGWQNRPDLTGKKIGQSYELYDKSNLSLALSSSDPEFSGEITDNKQVAVQSKREHSVPVAHLISEDAAAVLGNRIVKQYGMSMHLLLKYTQALGNSFQLHIPDGITNPKWKPKPESWYYFEPGLITCGVKKGVSWEAYKHAMLELDARMHEIARSVSQGELAYDDAKGKISSLVTEYDPWQYVNLVRVEPGTLLDLSPCGIHHSWEEDLKTIPLGNVLYEIQLNVMDDVATLRSFDKGKMSKEGKLRPLQIEEYFAYADRSESANDPDTHMRRAVPVSESPTYVHERLLESKYYSMDRIRFRTKNAEFTESIDTFRHLFVKSGAVDVVSHGVSVYAGQGHSVFVPAACKQYSLHAQAGNTEVLISY